MIVFILTKITYISIKTGTDFDALQPNDTEPTDQITKQKNRITLVYVEDTIHLLSTFHLKMSKCFENMKGREGCEEAVFMKIKEVKLKFPSDLCPCLILTSRERE